ncbi:sugar diacid recognition domain-containing protein [Oscillospiraceae bacterium PP1C4]
MKLAQIESVAQEIVNATAPLIGGRTINIMDTAGVIIASSDQQRIGTFHQGAAEVLKNRAPVRIFPSDLPHYSGSREGVNLPIIKGDKLLGVVGILGNPDEVEDTANLLGVYVGLYLEQAATAQRNILRREMRLSLLGQLISAPVDQERVLEAGRVLSLNLCLPIRAIALSIISPDRMHCAKSLDRIEELLASRGLIDPLQDVYGVLDGSLIILKYTPASFHAENCIQNLYSTVKTELEYDPSVAIGGEASCWNEIGDSYDEARRLGRLCGAGCANVEENIDKSLYLMSTMQNRAMERFIAPLYQAIRDGFGGDMTWMFATLEAYCACEFSVTKAAQQLHVHKNTLLYRIKKLLTLIGLEEEHSFTKSYFLKMLLIYDKRQNEQQIY